MNKKTKNTVLIIILSILLSFVEVGLFFLSAKIWEKDKELVETRDTAIATCTVSKWNHSGTGVDMFTVNVQVDLDKDKHPYLNDLYVNKVSSELCEQSYVACLGSLESNQVIGKKNRCLVSYESQMQRLINLYSKKIVEYDVASR